jgi:hypothetical protein
MQPLPLEQFKDRYYDPGLLGKHVGLHAQKPRSLNFNFM